METAKVDTKRVRTDNESYDFVKSKLENNEPEIPCVIISCGTCGQARGALKVVEAFKQEINRLNLEDRVKIRVKIRVTGCHGFCEVEPNLIIEPEGIFYVRLDPEDVGEIVRETIMNKKIIERLLYIDPSTDKKITCERDIPFYRSQNRLISGNNTRIDPRKIEDYISTGGYKGLAKALTHMTREDIISEMKRSGLCGRGGAGFPTGIKWGIAKEQEGDVKYVICNADEGDPGAYMDRSVLESNPHSVIEGMMIGGYAIGAGVGWIYLRNEYPLAIEHVTIAIDNARKRGLLGDNILDSGFSFDINIVRGAGAFVCGEETALIASIEGKKGIPRQRPPFPAQCGLFGNPTNINNVETWANVPTIITKGGDWYAEIGTEKSKGTKIFSLVGKVRNTGLVEVPMGITLNDIVYGIGGGAPNGKKVKAVQIGGPSGGCIPHELFHLPVDYESLKGAGAIMGSGGLIVMDEDSCMVDIARYFMNFLQEESCGKCSSCREGTQRMFEILSGITEGRGKLGDLALLEELGQVVKSASMCGLGQTASNPVLSTLRYFREEFIAHIEERKCPAGVCKALITYHIDQEKCIGCGLCKKNCPEKAIEGEPKTPHSIVPDRCIKCGICYDACKFDAIVKRSGGI